jgi:hypothetical protein
MPRNQRELRLVSPSLGHPGGALRGGGQCRHRGRGQARPPLIRRGERTGTSLSVVICSPVNVGGRSEDARTA